MTQRREKAARVGRKIIAFTDRAFSAILLLALLAMLAFGCYGLWDARQVHNAASHTQFEVYKPSEESSLSFEALQALNPETVGWITLYGTEIDYPLLQAEDNMKYINTAADGSYSLSGAIFLDCSSAPDFSDYNTIIHGHNMAENKMFGQIKEFADADFFAAHPYGNLYFDGKDHGFVLFEYFQADAYDSTVYDTSVAPEEEKDYLSHIYSMSLQNRNAGQEEAGHIVLLSTCALGYTNSRDILVGVLTDEPIEDPFDAARKARYHLDPLSLLPGAGSLPLWVITSGISICLMIITLIFHICCNCACRRRFLREAAEAEIVSL